MNRNLIDERRQDKRVPLVPSKVKRRKKLVFILWMIVNTILIIAIVIIGVHRFLVYTFTGDHRVALLTIDKDRQLDIRMENFADPMAGVWCRIIEKGKLLDVYGSLGYTKGSKTLSFQLLKSKDSSVIAVVEQSKPSDVLFLYDFISNTAGASFNSDSPSVNSSLAKLQEQYPNLRIVPIAVWPDPSDEKYLNDIPTLSPEVVQEIMKE